MNLTSKRMLQFMTVCAGACALTATATEFVADSFEAATNTNPIATYKSIVSEDFHTTNRVWISQAGDASTISTNDAANTAFAATTRPMSAAQTLLLNLATEGTTLSRMITNGVDECLINNTTPVYVDTLIKFTPSEDAPTITLGSVKVAVYVNVNSNLVVYHRTGGGASEVTNNVFTAIQINPANWYRLTIQMGIVESYPACKIRLNGVLLANALTFDDVLTANNGGAWFLTDVQTANLSAVAFQGTGAVDELLVTTVQPDVSSTGIFLTLMFTPAQVGITTSGVPVSTSPVTVANNTAVNITALPWYQITSSGALFTGPATTNKYVGTSMVTNITGGTVSGLNGQTNQIASGIFTESTGSTSTGLGAGSYPLNKVAAWATDPAKGNTATLTAGMLDEYLLNTAANANPGLKINSITYNGTIATITVVATNAAGVVDFSSINGTMGVTTRTNLTAGADFAEPAGFSVIGTTATNKTITIPTAAGPFIKAVVQ